MPRLLTRSRPERMRALSAAGARIDLSNRGEARRIQQRRQDWQNRAWRYYDDVGEVKYATNFLGNSLAKLRLLVAERNPDPEQPPIVSENARVQEPLTRIEGATGGHGDLLKPAATQFTVVGECYLIGLDAESNGGEELWAVRSIDEVIVKGEEISIKEGPEQSEGRKLDNDRDFVLRLWQPHERWSYLADSSLHGVLNQCEELLMIERAVRAAATNRAAGAGILTVPDELSHLERDPTTAQGEGDTDPFMEELIEALTAPIADEGHANAVVPMVVRGKAEQLKELRHVTLDRPLDKYLGERSERALRRLAQGLNVPVEVVIGIADLNHWSAWAIDEATFKSHIEPLAQLLCGSLTSGYLRPYLTQLKIANPENYLVWYDATDLVVRPNRADDAKWAHTALIISDSVARESLGFSDEDAPQPDEIERRTPVPEPEPEEEQIPEEPDGDEGETPASQARVIGRNPRGAVLRIRTPEGVTPPLTPEDVLSHVNADANGNVNITIEQSGFIDETGTATTPPPQAEAIPRRSLGERLLAIDQHLLTRLEAACDAVVRRVLEKAGARLRSKLGKDQTLRAAVASVGQIEVAATLGPALVAGLGFADDDLISGGMNQLEGQFDRWVADAQTQALRLVPGLGDDERAEAQRKFSDYRREAWAWLRDTLEKVAVARLYDPNPEAPPMGEFDETVLVPYGIVREAISRAGGAVAPGVNVNARVAQATYTTLEPELVSAGLAGGSEMRDILAKHDNFIIGYEWVYGDYPRTRPFEPHLDLDGKPFKNFDDDVLRNAEPFPATEFFIPGDHDGCRCDFMPIFGTSPVLTGKAPAFDDPQLVRQVDEAVRVTRTRVDQVEAGLRDVMEEVGDVEFQGLPFREKVRPIGEGVTRADQEIALERLYEKVAEMHLLGEVNTIEAGVAELGDLARFTFIAEPSDYVAALDRVQTAMKRAGFQQVKWKPLGMSDSVQYPTAMYKGTNTNWIAPNGQLFELQIHTEETARIARTISHKPFEAYRKITATPLEKARKAVELVNIWRGVKLP